MGDPDEKIKARPASISSAKDDFNDYAKQFDNTIYPLGTCHNDIATGAGEFEQHISTGNAKFLLGWRETLQACSETTGIMAGNMGNYAVDLNQVDIDQSVTVTI